MRARRRGADVRALRTRYMALRAQSVSLSLPGPDPIESVPLRPLAKVLQRAESLAAQLADQTQRAADLSIRLALADKATQQERVEHERTRDLLASARASQVALKEKRSKSSAALRLKKTQAKVRATLRQTRQQLAQVRQERDQAGTFERKLKAELKPLQESLRRAEQARDAAQQALSAPRAMPQASPSTELVQAQRAAQAWQAQAAQLTRELASVRSQAVAAQLTTNKSADKYDPAHDWLVWHKRNEIKERDELESWDNGTGRLRPQKKTLDQRAFEAAQAARYTLLTHPPKGYRKPVSWAIPERVLDAASEKYLCDESSRRSAEMFMKLPLAGRRKNR